MSARFQYKCRLCGEVYTDSACGEELAKELLFCAVYGYDQPERMIGQSLKMVDIHAGCQKGAGVADLIGYTIE